LLGGYSRPFPLIVGIVMTKTPKHSSEWDDPHEPETPAPEKAPAAAGDGRVRVKCTSYTRPFAEGSPFEFGEEREVSAEVAKILKEHDLVEDV
jgi:hypothetical protein